MKKLLFLILLTCLATSSWGFGIVNNSTSSQTAHDSLSIPFYLLDSAGNQVAIASGDSVFLVVWYPGGALAFQDSGAYNDADITSQTRHGMSWYNWQAQVSNLDGTPTEGVYSYVFSVHDKTSANLWTSFNGNFQLYATSDFDKVLDSIGIGAIKAGNCLDSLQAQDGWIAHQSTSDSLLDTLPVNFKQMDVNATGQVGINLDNVVGTLDAGEIGTDAITADELSNVAIDKFWEYAQASITSAVGIGYLYKLNQSHILDTVYAIIDSLQAGVVIQDTTNSGKGLLTYSGGVDSTLLLKRCIITGANGADGSFQVVNSSGDGVVFGSSGGNGDGLYAYGNGSGNGFIAYGGSSNGSGIAGLGQGIGSGMYVLGGTNGDGLKCTGRGTGHDINLAGIGSINGNIDSCASSVSTPVNTDGDTLARVKDSAAFQGAAGSAATIAAAVWDLDTAGHYVVGKYGYEACQGGGGSSGSGMYSYTLVAIDSSANQVLPGVNLVARNINQSALIAVGTTDMQGKVNLNLDADSFIVIPFLIGYTFESYDTLVVTGTGVDSMFGYPFNPGSPESPDLCRLYGFLYDIAGNPEGGATVTARLHSGVSRVDSGIVSPFRVGTSSDSTGYFYLDLIPNTSLNPDSTKYEITVTLSNGTVLRERVIVPDESSWLLTW